ncbi:hypothetical protein QBC34DRAFT_417618 [Podospora aff. communis PSN243]|uniref:2EXR domain-containing protein n=1 Tax=Podospora aff. communis PSN243 TaxID=3040156 RepID=A0AAV9G4U0_9PEZI|nr:hypothetical protein QBC34DRAFT_417618 [Podospora aff. communis PSN243]
MTPVQTDTARQFTVFPRLPTEVRLIIWSHACRTERIIPLLPGKGHLFPIVHPSLAIPPVLHACSESRAVALKHYDLSFHRHIYINHECDQLMLHIFFPYKIIDWGLYFGSESGNEFNWDAAPRRLAVLLDDISFHQSDEDERNDAWRTDPAWRQRLLPISAEFAWSITVYPLRVEELTLLVLPPLTARPNCAAQRFDLVEGMSYLVEMSNFLEKELRDRIHDNTFRRCLADEDEEVFSPVVRVRHATCSPWTSSAAADISWSAASRDRHPAEHYADLEFGQRPTREEQPEVYYASSGDLPPCTAHRNDRILAIRRDLKRLREPFCSGVGLGPYVLWEEPRYMCGTSKGCAGLVYDARKQLLWVGDEELPESSYFPGTDFDFDKFLSDATEFVEACERKVEEQVVELEEDNGWATKTFRACGLIFWD